MITTLRFASVPDRREFDISSVILGGTLLSVAEARFDTTVFTIPAGGFIGLAAPQFVGLTPTDAEFDGDNLASLIISA